MHLRLLNQSYVKPLLKENYSEYFVRIFHILHDDKPVTLLPKYFPEIVSNLWNSLIELTAVTLSGEIKKEKD